MGLTASRERANISPFGKGGLCMLLGGIYTSQKCPICGKTMKDDGRRKVGYPAHPEFSATKIFVKFKGGIFQRFTEYDQAQRFLTGLRYKFDEGSFDARDYRRDNPLGFETLASQWLEVKKGEIKPSSYSKIRQHIQRGIIEWGQRNIKDIGYAEIEDFLGKQKLEGSEKPVSSKTRSNIRSTLHNFWMWLKKRRILRHDQIPEFPEVSFQLAWRSTIDKETQQRIIQEVKRISYEINPKIWLGIKWLATYIAIRPNEMLNIKEGDFDLGLGVVVIRDPKEKKPKTVPLLDQDIEILRSLPRGLPDLYFFRHLKGLSGAIAGEKFGEKYFYKWWIRACDNLGIEGVDLYGGTRHSSARALRELHSPEEIRRATMHATNKAFERYFSIEIEDIRRIYNKTQVQKLIT